MEQQLPYILSNLGHCLIIRIFMGSKWPMFSESTARPIFCEMETGDRLRVAQIFTLKNHFIGPNS